MTSLLRHARYFGYDVEQNEGRVILLHFDEDILVLEGNHSLEGPWYARLGWTNIAHYACPKSTDR